MFPSGVGAFVPQYWAQEGVEILWENMKYIKLFNMDYNNQVQNYGDTVKVHKVSATPTRRKQNDQDDLVSAQVAATSLDVKLNQRIYNSFLLGDAAQSLSFPDLVKKYLTPAMKNMASMCDRILAVQAYQFLAQTAGGLGQMTKTNSHDYLIDTREAFNNSKVPEDERWMGLASRSEAYMQKNELFKDASRVGDRGQALSKAYLGQKGGWDLFLELNTPSIKTATMGAVAATATVAYAAGVTTLDLAASHGVVAGQYIVIADDWRPLKVLTVSTNTITLNRGLSVDIAASRTVTKVAVGAINQGSAIDAGDQTLAVSDGYPAGWQKEITVDGTGVPKVGQLISIGATSTVEYGIVEVLSATSILLDRPLEAAVADNAVIGYGPNGDYNFAFHSDCLTVVNRPLWLPPDATAAIGSLEDKFAIRVEFSREGSNQTLRCTIDALLGLKVLDSAKAAVLLG